MKENAALKDAAVALSVRGLQAGYAGGAPVLRGVNLDIREKTVTAIIGPSGCGKSTLIRCLNRMHEAIPGATADGEILLDGRNAFDLDPVVLRRSVAWCSSVLIRSPRCRSLRMFRWARPQRRARSRRAGRGR